MYSSLRQKLHKKRKQNRKRHSLTPSLMEYSVTVETQVVIHHPPSFYLPYHFYPCSVILVAPECEWDHKIRNAIVWAYKLFRDWNIPYQNIHILSYDFTLSSTPPTLTHLQNALKTSSHSRTLFVYMVDPQKVRLVKWVVFIQQWFGMGDDHADKRSDHLNQDGFCGECIRGEGVNPTIFLMLDTGVLCHKNSLKNYIHDAFNL